MLDWDIFKLHKRNKREKEEWAIKYKGNIDAQVYNYKVSPTCDVTQQGKNGPWIEH